MISKLTIKKMQVAKIQRYMNAYPEIKKSLVLQQKLLKLKREVIEIERCNGLISIQEANKRKDEQMRQFAVGILCLDLGV